MSLMDYFKLRTPQLQHLAGGGDSDAKKELSRRMRDAPPSLDVTKLTYLEARVLVKAWRDGATAEERVQSRLKAEAAQRELEARFRVRARLGWRREDADIYGPEHTDTLPMAPWLIPRPPRCISWQRPMSSTLYPSDVDIARSRMNEFARTFYKTAAGAPPPKE